MDSFEMDQLQLLEYFESLYLTEEGAAMGQAIYQMVTQGRNCREMLEEAGKVFLTSDYTPERCDEFYEAVSLCLQDVPLDIREDLDLKVIMSICTKLDAYLPQITDVFQAIEFFYKTMMLVKTVAVLDGNKPGGQELLVHVMCRETASRLWLRLFFDTKIYMLNWKRTVDLLKDLRELVVENIPKNPAFSYYVLEDLLRGFQMMHYKFTKQQNINLQANMYLLMAKCSFQAERYKLTTAHCEKASQLFDCSSYLAYELWAMALHRSGQYQAAINRLESARECTQERGVLRHLKVYMEEVHKDMSANTQKVSSEPDDDWLVGTNVHTTQQLQARAQQQKNAHVKKKKHSRPKREVVELPKISPNDWKITSGKKKVGGGESPQNGDIGSCPSKLTPENNPLLRYTDWDTTSEDDSSDESIVKVAVEELEEKEPVGRKVKVIASDKTWYEESHEMYLNGEEDDKIVCGMLMDVDIDSILAHTVEGRAPFYRPMECEDNMNKFMRTMPDRYKRCRIELESCHKAVCKVLSSGENTEIEIHGRSKCGQTFNHDEVCVEILAKPRPHAGPTTILTKRTEDDNKVFGQVVGLLRTNFKANQHPVLACTCDDEDGFLMHPLCKSVPKIHALNGRTKKKYPSLAKYRIDTYRIDDKGQLQFKRYFDVKPGLRGRYVFVVVYLTWGIHHVYPLGAVVDVLECGTDFSGGMKILEMQYQVPSNFTRDTIRHIDKMLKKKGPVPSDQRVDCRDLTVFTIDPEHSKDLDDALSICKKEDHFIVGVHIADVAAVVKKSDPVDKEAKRRATSFYPSDSRVRHMLPEPLSEQLCSLRPNEDKCALSVFFHIEESGNVKDVSVKRTLIRSSLKLSYKAAQKVIEGETVEAVPENIKDGIHLLHRIAQKLRNGRMKDSRFAVPFEDPRFLDTEALEEAPEAHALIEEFMIKANTYIAAWLKKKYPVSIPIRCQSEPPLEELQKFVQTEDKFLDLVVGLQGREILPARKVAAENVVAKGNSVRKEYLPVQKNVWLQILDGVHAGNMKDSMKALCQDEVHPFQAVALNHWRSIMESAEYRCSMETERNLNHFSLQTKLYTHFTSPIRRYVDLVVHRLVHAALDDQPCPYSPKEVSEMCAYINDATARQKHFSNGCQALRRAEKIAQQPMAFKAFVSNLTDSGAELCIPSLKHISSRSKELPFNLMDFSTKPDEKTDPVSGKTIVRGKWKKRLYDCVGCPDQLVYSKANDRLRYNPEVEVDPHQYVFFVDSQTWAKTMTACFNEDVKNLKKILNSQSEEGQEGPRTGQHRTIVTSEYGDGTVKYQQCKFEYCFSPGRVIKVQMVANPLSGLLTPQVRLFQVSKNLSLCLTHMEDPVGVLSKYATESSKKNIESIAEYQRIWLPLLEMEAATSAVHSEENVIINNVKLDFKSRKGKTQTFYNGSFTLPAKFVSDRYIEFSGLPIESLTKKQLDEEDDKIMIGKKDFSSVDYLCIRCPIKQPKLDGKGDGSISQGQVQTSEKETKAISQSKKRSRSRSRSRTRSKTTERKSPEQEMCCVDQCQNEEPYTWVGHGQIVKVRRWKSDIESEFVTVTFTLNTNSPAVPDSLRPSAVGTVEVIFKSMVDRTSMAMVQSLSSSKLEVDLAKCIALHRGTPKLGGNRFDLGKKIEKEVYIGILPKNNQNQLAAIDKALTSSFTLIQGPPGTGKTYTGIKLMFLFNKINKIMVMEGQEAKKKQVLFCGPSNKAVDLVARYMLYRLGESCPKIIRVYGSNIESQDYPIPKRNFMSRRSTHDLKSDTELFNVTLHHMVRMQTNTKSSEIRTYDAFFRKNPDAVKIGQIKKYRKILFAAYCEELKKCDIILCTCAVGGNMKLSKATDIQQVVIDECAMSTEPQSMVPIIASQAKQVVLIGDHKQLRPIIQCKEAAELGLDRSLFERYEAQTTFLNIQYRMHPRICEFPSEMFYKGRLETGPSISWKTDTPLTLWPVENVPHVLCHVEGVEESLAVSTEEGNEQSKSNSAEVDKVEQVYDWLVKKEKIPPKYINVMSQYNAQCSKIKEKLGKYHNKDIHVNTVVASQGGEWDYVIFSTVRSLPEYKIERNPTLGWSKHNLGFITDQNQINVALTRARKGLIIIGNQNLLRSDKVFRELIVKYEKQGCLVDSSEFPRRRTQENRRRRAQIPGADWKEV